jgi:hypothetical protein
MGFFTDVLIKLGFMNRPKLLRKKDRRRIARRWERTSEYKASPEYQSRLKRDRRKGERRK